MGLSAVLARTATRSAHVLVVEVPGRWRTRAAVERAALARGWVLALSPADADVLAVCGEPGSDLGAAVEHIWHQMPGPRVRVDIQDGLEAASALEQAHADLLDTARHTSDAVHRLEGPDLGSADPKDEDAGHDMGHDEHGDDGGMAMSPGGVPLAQGGQGRDGLEMDVLNVRLGPLLPYWPAGLVVNCALQGDVITEATASLLDDGSHHYDPDSVAPGRRLDNIVSLLALAGWDDAAAEARIVRDTLLQGAPRQQTRGRLALLHRRIARSWVLRWSLRGIRRLDEQEVLRTGLPADAVGDTYDRLRAMISLAVTEIEAEAGTEPSQRGSCATIATGPLAGLVTGLDLATARLVVASLDIHELRQSEGEHEVRHG